MAPLSASKIIIIIKPGQSDHAASGTIGKSRMCAAHYPPIRSIHAARSALLSSAAGSERSLAAPGKKPFAWVHHVQSRSSWWIVVSIANGSLGSGLNCHALHNVSACCLASAATGWCLAATASSRQAHLYQRILLLRGMKPFQILRVLAPSALYRSVIGRLMG